LTAWPFSSAVKNVSSASGERVEGAGMGLCLVGVVWAERRRKQ
jgi:hypothetical protein